MNMITKRVCVEMYKAKGYQKQIELYTDRKRWVNRKIIYLIVGTSFICAITACFPQCRLATFATSMIVAATTIIRELKPMYGQPEEELRELDRISVFYKGYLHELENLFILRYDSKSDMNDMQMADKFDKIVKSEGDNETNLNRLCRKLKQKERDIIQKDTKNYFDKTLPDTKYYI